MRSFTGNVPRQKRTRDGSVFRRYIESPPLTAKNMADSKKQTSVRDLNVELDAKDLLDTSGLGLHVSLAMTVMGGKDAAAATEQLRRRWTDSTALSLMG